ncbi:hypothetical protein B296_00007688 [Ensete ventricosum]|uniref:Uncharacterized protein n=1 Tax=Ensete ventricosum TaxID=4639 RepID=A0A427AUA9_ENSVE|nr:hypothetical protein B296_00007688 [Ensete ventricosum]
MRIMTDPDPLRHQVGFRFVIGFGSFYFPPVGYAFPDALYVQRQRLLHWIRVFLFLLVLELALVPDLKRIAERRGEDDERGWKVEEKCIRIASTHPIPTTSASSTVSNESRKPNLGATKVRIFFLLFPLLVFSVEENKEGLKEPEERTVHPDCINASNPFHDCSEFCFKRIAEAKDRIERNESGFPFSLSFMNEF